MKTKAAALIFCFLIIVSGGCEHYFRAAETLPVETIAPPSSNPSAAPSPIPEEPSLPSRQNYRLPFEDSGTNFSIYAAASEDVLDSIFSVGQNRVWREISKRTGINLSFTSIPYSDMSRKYTEMFTSRDYPDAVSNLTDHYINGVSAALQDGVIIDLLPYLDEYAPNLSWYLHRDEADIRHALSDEGAMPYIPRIMEQPCDDIQGPILRGDWLEELGLDIPRTYSDYYEVLKAFKENYGATLWLRDNGDMRWSGWSGGYGTAGDLYLGEDGNRYPFFVRDGELLWGPATREYENYISMLAEWYEQGLIYGDFSEKTGELVPVELVQNGEVGVFVAGHSDLDVYGSGSDTPGFKLVGAPAPVLTEGDINHFNGNYGEYILTDSTFSITSACKNPGLLLKVFDYRFSPQGAVLSNFGIVDETFVYAQGMPKFTELVMIGKSTKIGEAERALYLSQPGAYPEFQRIYEQNYSDEASALPDIWRQNRDGAYELPSSITLTSSERGRFETLIGRIADFVSENIPKFIRGDIPMSQFKDFQREQYEMGLELCVEIYQTAYDRWLARAEKTP